MNTEPKKTSSRTIWIAAGAALILLACACVIGALVFGGAFFAFGPRGASRTGGVSDSTPAPASLCKWQRLASLPRKINTIVFDPVHAGTVYAGTGRYMEGGGGLYKSRDGGATWQLATQGLPDDIVVAIALSRDASVIYANVGPGGAIYASTDAAGSWHLAGNDDALCCNVDRQMIVLPDDPGKIIIVQPAADPNISTSQDGGATWQRFPDDRDELKPSYLALAPLDPRTMYLGSDGHGVYKSADGGQTWMLANQGMLDYRIQTLAVSAADPRTLYAGSQEGHLFKTTDGGGAWTDITAALALSDFEYGDIRGVFIDPRTPDTVYVVKGIPDRLLRSTDGGSTWKQFALPPSDFPAQFSVTAMNFDPRLQILMGLYYNSGDNSGAWRCVP